MEMICEEKWRPDSKERSWAVTRVEIWVVMDSKSETVAVGPIFVRNADEMCNQIRNVLKYRDKNGFNMFYDNAEDYTAFRVGALELSTDKFVFIPTDRFFLDYTQFKSNGDTENAENSQQV